MIDRLEVFRFSLLIFAIILAIRNTDYRGNAQIELKQYHITDNQTNSISSQSVNPLRQINIETCRKIIIGILTLVITVIAITKYFENYHIISSELEDDD